MDENVVTWVPNAALAERVPAATRAAVDSMERLIRSGAFTPPGAWTGASTPAARP